jgi:hypothetical protein
MLDSSKEELLHAIEASQIGVWKWDVTTNVIIWSEHLEKLFGLRPGEFKGSFNQYIALLHSEDRERCQQTVQAAIENRQPYQMEHRCIWPDGSVRWLLGKGQAFFGEDGTLLKMTGVTVDITERKNQEESLARKTIELERFAAIAAHDLRAPLNSMIQFTELLASQYQGQLSKDADEYIDFIVSAGNRMRNFIDSLLLYAKSGNLNPKEIRDIYLNDIVGTVRKNLLSEIQKTDAQILTQGQLPKVVGSEMQLTQLLQNLVANSIKFRKPNIAPQIFISAQKMESKWLVTLEDNGQGIESKNIPYIFDFLRRFNTNDLEGTGIGLAVCKKIVHAHGGTIEAKSEVGKGSIFQFTLPGNLQQLKS